MTTADILQIMRKRLKVTWADEIEDSNIEMMLASGIAYLNGSAGEDIDFSVDSFALELLYVYTMYARNDSIAAFREAYAPDLLKLHLQYKARRAKGESESEA
jgi:hypothetical protein